jgi:hypothetical protein
MKIYSPTITGSAENTNIVTTTRITSLSALSSSFASTASSADNLTVRGTLTAQTINVQTITSSIEFITGSTRNGSLAANTHQFTGSVLMTGSLTVTTTGTELQVNAGGVNIGNALTDNHVISGSVRINPNGLFVSSSGDVGVGTNSPNYKLDVNGVIVGGDGTIRTTISFATGGVIGTLTNHDLQLYTAGGEKMRITSGGNVGIGTTSPAAVLHVNGGALPMVIASTSATELYCEYRYNTTSVLGYIGNGTGLATGAGETNFGIRAQNALIFASNGANERMRIDSAGAVVIKGASTGNLLRGLIENFNTYFNIYATEGGGLTKDFGILNGGSLSAGRIILKANGNVTIGTDTDNGYRLNVSGNIYASSNIYSNSSIYAVGGIGSNNGIVIDYGYQFGLNSNNQNAANAWHFFVSTSFSNNLRFFYGGTGIGTGTARAQIDTSGNYSALSDVNKKKNIALSTLGLNEVLLLKPSTFKFKDDENDEEQLGFIAQEVKDVIPHAYYEDAEGDDKFIGLKYNTMIPVLVKAIQELKSENDTLKEILQRNNIQ